jgi:hypothetical protein
MLRADRLWTMLTVVGIERALAASPLCDDEWCTWCRQEKRELHRAAGGSLFDVGELRVVPEPTLPAPLAIEPAAAVVAEPVPIRPDATCSVCGGWLSPTVVADGFNTHPSCDLPTVADAPRPVPATPQPAALAPVINLFDR